MLNWSTGINEVYAILLSFLTDSYFETVQWNFNGSKWIVNVVRNQTRGLHARPLQASLIGLLLRYIININEAISIENSLPSHIKRRKKCLHGNSNYGYHVW